MTSSKNGAIFVSATHRIQRLLVATVFVVASHWPLVSHAWSEAGHVTITELAVRDLPREVRRSFNEIAEQLVQPQQAAEMRKRYGNLSSIALVSSWLDRQRGHTVAELFERHGTRLPPELEQYRKTTTDDWHYSNQPYSGQPSDGRNDTSCNLNSGELATVLPVLVQAFSSAETNADKAIILAMLTHLIADAHQPLHSVTLVTESCAHDRGGNSFCLDQDGTRCRDSLHAAWDQGFGVFRRGDLDRTLAGIDGGQAVKASEARNALRPDQWLAESFALADGVYAAVEGRPLDERYRRWAREVARERADQAAERTAMILGTLMSAEAPSGGR